MATRAKGVNAAHTAGIFADMTLDGPEIGTLVAVIDRAKNLPNRKTMGKQDPYCAMRLGKEAKKTDTDKRGGQTPRWDQELRFTVHESPDYYKLKCSVFNDDKKTDLIGEAWFDLQDVIVPGGGQSDRWRQLNFKGKYAGDIRIELTYYDTRPKPEIPTEARRQRDKAHSTTSEGPSTLSGSRQLGPREIKRRPLPPGPAGHPPPLSAAPASEHWNDEEQPDIVSSQGYSDSNPPPRPPKQKFVPETPDDVGYDLNPRFGPDSYEPQYGSNQSYHQRYQSNDFQNNYEPSTASYPEPDLYDEDPFQGRPLPAQPRQPHSVSGLPPPEQQFQATPHSPYDLPDHQSYNSPPAPRTTPQATPHSPYDLPDHHSYNSSPAARTTPQATPPAAIQNQQWTGRTSTSPVKYATYRDSPLRQSVSHNDMPLSAPSYQDPDPRFDEDEPAPPPPAHRGQITRISVGSAKPQDRGDYNAYDAPAPAPYRDSHGQPPPRTPVKYQSVEDRSPLQRLEHDYDTFHSTPPSMQGPQRQLPPPEPFDASPTIDHGPYPVFPTERRKSNNYDIHQSRQTSSHNDVSPSEQPDNQAPPQHRYRESPRDDFRHSTGHAPPRRAQTFDNSELHDERHDRRSDLIVVRPRAISPHPNHSIPRKSITPTPRTPDDSKNMSSTPYGPDSYDMLNPGTSPTVDTDAFKSPDGALEAARQTEVDKLRDQGPIIGNDGRVIDPSDHLPADTWAPEPERKQRKPEHVIKIRTREEARMHRNAGSSPSSARPHSIAVSPYQSSPPAPISSPYYSSPAVAGPPVLPQMDSPNGRNRLRKPMPQRPLPSQPYPAHPESAPTLPSLDARPSPTNQRYSIHSSPAGTLPQRPPLSEYSVPATNNYSPRSSAGPPALEYRQEYIHKSPTRPPLDRQQPSDVMEYGGGSPYGGENPLALELSRIDIGPSRIGGRTTLRPQKAYGMY